jgi:hypothetical protein
VVGTLYPQVQKYRMSAPPPEAPADVVVEKRPA